VWNGEDNTQVIGVEKVALLCFEPSPPGLRLALGAAAWSSGLLGDTRLVSAFGFVLTGNPEAIILLGRSVPMTAMNSRIQP